MEVLISYEENVAKDLMQIVELSIIQLTALTAEDFDKKAEKPFSIENEKFTSRFELQEVSFILFLAYFWLM